MAMDFDAITEFWFGSLPEPKLPFEPLDLGVNLPEEKIELVNPLSLEPEPSTEG